MPDLDAARVGGLRARYSHSLWLLTRRNLTIRYSTSLLGYLWSIIDPLIMSAIYFFVFVVVLERADIGAEDPYIVFLLCALLPWSWFNGAVSDATRAFAKEGKLVRSVKIPRTIWVNQLVLAKGIEFLASLPVLLIFAALSGAVLHWQAVYALGGLLLQAILTVGVGLIVAPLVVFFRDLERVVKLGLRFLFYASPIVYGISVVPEAWHPWLDANPLSGIFSLYRAAFFPGQIDGFAVVLSAVISLLLLGIGLLVFRRAEGAVLKAV